MDSNGDFDGNYEVFLSFRGKDTRQGFTDILYEYMTSADIRVFRDDDELAIGDKIDSILEAINSSKICIPIFSPNFAESKWCLREVTRMVELKKMIVPVFYKVSPDDVKLKQKSVYADDFKKLQQKNHGDAVEIEKWKYSLREAASNKGRELGYKSYTHFCKELVNEVLSKLGPRARLDIDHFVGDTNKEEVLKLLDMGSSSQEVVYLGIHGMGGIGKTTLTKLIYNEFLFSFEYCGFVPDIREFSANKGVDGLPTYLCDNLQPKPLTRFSRSEHIPNQFRYKKVLLILDDVDSDEQIKKIAREPNWFGLGSKIILTSRDKKVFEDFESASKCEIQYLEMEELERGGSLELFSRCAFGKSSPPSSYQDLSERAVSYAGGLPLAVTVIANYLRNQKEVIWEEVIRKLKKSPLKEVNARLLISYESLENEQKKIFLDIACLFNRFSYSERSHIFYMWQACELYPHWSLEILQSRSLVKLVENEDFGVICIKMHDQLIDLGRDIVISKSGDNLMKQSRVWKDNQVLEVLNCKEKQKNMIEALDLMLFKDIVFSDEEFVSFDNLRYLGLYHGSKLIGDFSNLFPKLVWLRCRDILEVKNLAPSNLVILHLSQSNVDENWDGWSQILMLKSLKVLDLSGCERLRRTPVFPENMHLERLDLSNCRSLVHIDNSIGRLEHLAELKLSGCSKLKNLPESCGELHALRGLYAIETSIKSLPNSIGGLQKLEHLSLKSRKWDKVPQSLGNLHSLRELTLEGSLLTSWPESIRRLEKLEKLNLSFSFFPDSELQYLPELPSSLKELRLSIECYGLNKDPGLPLSNLRDLTSLTISSSSKLQDLTIGLLSLSRLLDLTLSSCKAMTDLTGIGELQSLTSLTIGECPSLVNLGNLDKLKELRTFHIYWCPRLVGIPGLGKLQSLTELGVVNNDSLELLDDITGLEELKRLYLSYCRKRTKIPGLVNLKNLRFLDVDGCESTEILQVASQMEKLHGTIVVGMPDWYVHNIDGVPEPCESSSAILDLDKPSLHYSQIWSSCIEQRELATNQLSGEVEGNSCDDDMQSHNLGAGLATHQCKLEDFPPSKTKRSWCCWKLAVQDTPMQPK